MKLEAYWNQERSMILVENLNTNSSVSLDMLPTDMILELDDIIMKNRPHAYELLCKEFGIGHKSAYKRVFQFFACNFSTQDGHPDIHDEAIITEKVPCPVRNFCALGFCISEVILSAREKEVIQYFAQGMREEKIADLLFISKSTVHNHVNNIYSKLGFTGSDNPDRLLMRYAIQNKII